MSVFKHNISEEREGYDVNVLLDDIWHSLPYEQQKDLPPPEGGSTEGVAPESMDDERIDSLVLTVKAPESVTALNSVKHRLTPDSSILFLQNGMGVLEEVNEKVFPDPNTRPHYVMGITSHGLYRLRSFNIIHAGVGTTILGTPNQASQATKTTRHHKTATVPVSEDAPATTRHLLHSLTRAPGLTAVHFDSVDFLQHRLEKLAINCVINPLTVIMDCTNGELLYNYFLSRIMRLLLIEISAVVCAMPELQGVPGVQARFSPERLRTLTLGTASKTKNNVSSTLQDVRQGKKTEIKYLNGYIVRKGEELGIKCALNYMVTQFVHAKHKQNVNLSYGEVPLDLSGIPDLDREK
ncbi:hypothetical protein FQN54_004456 [Arachnomyces sp. PD_36]|nr:hypothetical protein FQN54_004456 [Arachnomyces sp. PD_36]